MKGLISKLRWWLGLYDKSGVRPVTYAAYIDMREDKTPHTEPPRRYWLAKRPCRKHSLAVANLHVPEVKKIQAFMRRCEKCGWYYKQKEN